MAKLMSMFLLGLLAVASYQVAADQSGSSSSAQSGSQLINFRVHMDGRLNGVRTRAFGKILATIDVNNQVINGFFKVRDIDAVTEAHFHVGAAGVNGGVVAWIWPLDTKTMTTQPFSVGSDYWVVPFTITAADIMPSTTTTPSISDFSDFVNAIVNGNIYANVHTQRFPQGEIRGQTQVISS